MICPKNSNDCISSWNYDNIGAKQIVQSLLKLNEKQQEKINFKKPHIYTIAYEIAKHGMPIT